MNLNLKSEHKTIVKRFHEKYIISENGCWDWSASITNSGYGRLRESGCESKTFSAHRVSFILHKGGIPSGMLVLHKCDNRKCVNPDHLFLGTTKDNALDREGKGRGANQKGSANPNSKLNNELVIKIRSMKKSGKRISEISKELNLAKSTVSNAIYHTWKHV